MRYLRSDARLEAGDQPGFKAANLRRLLVGCHYDLLVRVVQGVEGVEELLLQSALVAKVVHVVDQEHVNFAEAVPELGVALVLQGFDIVVQEFFAGDVFDDSFRAALHCVVCNSLHEMGFAQAGVAIDVQRIVYARRLGGRHGCGIGVAVFLADHEILEGVADVAVRGRARIKLLCREVLIFIVFRSIICGFRRRLGFLFAQRTVSAFKDELHIVSSRLFQGSGDDV